MLNVVVISHRKHTKFSLPRFPDSVGPLLLIECTPVHIHRVNVKVAGLKQRRRLLSGGESEIANIYCNICYN